MRIVLHLDVHSPAVTVDESDDFRHFALVVVGGSFEEAVKVLGPYGRFVDQGTAAILPDAVRELSGKSHDSAWLSGFDAMLLHAGDAGWIDERTSGILAHCEWVGLADLD